MAKYHCDVQHIKNTPPCTPPFSVETFSGNISTSNCSSKEIAGLDKKKKKKKNYYDDDDRKFVKSRLAVFSRGELTVRMNLLGTCIARNGPDSRYLGVLKA